MATPFSHYFGDKLILEIGCGEKKKFANSIGLDIRSVADADILADACRLPFENDCFDHIYSSHVVEHMSHASLQIVLREWIRVLKVGGVFELRCPDLRARAFLFFLTPSWKNVQNIYGAQDYSENYHKSGFSYDLLRHLLQKLGITKVRRVHDGYKGVPFIPNDLHIRGIKFDPKITN